MFWPPRGTTRLGWDWARPQFMVKRHHNLETFCLPVVMILRQHQLRPQTFGLPWQPRMRNESTLHIKWEKGLRAWSSIDRLRLTWTRFEYCWSSRIAAVVAVVGHGTSDTPYLPSSHSSSPHASGDTRHGTPARSKRPGSSSGKAGILRVRNGASEPGMSVEDTLVNRRPPDEALINRHHRRCQEPIARQATMPSTQLQT
ncbi:hypothetical protein MRS44_004467 [Fusarium solani]|uniref:uncharacterized protein n=1 Tax=Fusarium solani TaxID=169388 RepID=UPI0032C47F48|nr:hypothetical protein MRS44_004467 [Fusarium solani]